MTEETAVTMGRTLFFFFPVFDCFLLQSTSYLPLPSIDVVR